MSTIPITRAWLVDFVGEVGIGVVATTDPSGHPEAALVGLAPADDGALLFDTEIGSRKLANLAVNHAVAVVVSVGEVAVQVEGTAEALEGERRSRAGRPYEQRFPGSRAMDEGFALVRIWPRWMRYYDARVEPAEVVETEFPSGAS